MSPEQLGLEGQLDLLTWCTWASHIHFSHPPDPPVKQESPPPRATEVQMKNYR